MKSRSINISALILAAVLALLLVAGCGSSSSDSSSNEAQTERSAEFLVPGKDVPGDVSFYTKFGHESNAAEREAASKALAKNLKARASGDWKGQCATLSVTAKESQVQEQAKFITGHKLPCPAALAKASETAPPYVLADTLNGRPITAFRVEGDEGVALYHGKKHNYAMLMKKENGVWKANKLTTFPLPIPPKSK